MDVPRSILYSRQEIRLNVAWHHDTRGSAYAYEASLAIAHIVRRCTDVSVHVIPKIGMLLSRQVPRIATAIGESVARGSNTRAPEGKIRSQHCLIPRNPPSECQTFDGLRL